MTVRHEILGGKVQLYKRDGGRFWQCSASVGGVQHRSTTQKEELPQAEDAAEDWFLELRGKFKRGDLGTLVKVNGETTFAEAAEQFLREFPIMTEGQRNPQYVEGHERRIRKYLIPFFGEKGLSQVTSSLIQQYRIHRLEQAKQERGAPPARNTMHQEMVALRQVLKLALRHGHLAHLPDMSQPYRTNSKVSHRAWFSPEEYKRLYAATRRRSEKPPKPRWRWSCEQLHDYVLFMVNTGLRPDEAARLQFRDVTIVDDDRTGETILEIEVRGKRGTGYCKSTKGAVHPFTRLRNRLRPKDPRHAESLEGPNGKKKKKEWSKPESADLIFPLAGHRELFNTVLDDEKLKFDREGQRRTAYSLRHTYICLRLMEGADIYQIAKNCRTSVEMIENYYASHIKTRLDAAAINVMRPRKRPTGKKPGKTALTEEAAL
jgi:integrase